MAGHRLSHILVCYVWYDRQGLTGTDVSRMVEEAKARAEEFKSKQDSKGEKDG